jgi:hypothetical protein
VSFGLKRFRIALMLAFGMHSAKAAAKAAGEDAGEEEPPKKKKKVRPRSSFVTFSLSYGLTSQKSIATEPTEEQ